MPVNDHHKPKSQLIEELKELRQQNSQLQAQQTEYKHIQSKLETTLHNLNIHQEELKVQNEQLRKAQQDLETSQKNYRHLFDFAPIGYFTLDHSGQIQQVNLTGAEMLGYPAAYLVNKPLFLYVTPSCREPLALHLRKVLSGTETTVEVTFVHKTGQNIPVVLSTVPTNSESTLVSGCLVAAMNITERKKAEKALQNSEARYRDLAEENARLLEQARQDAKTKTTLLNEVNHRVKNNLSAIMGLLHVEQQHFTDQNGQTDYQDMIKEIIGQIRSMAVVHSLVSASWWSSIRLDELAQRICEAATQMLPSNQVLTLQVTPSSVKVSAEQANRLALVVNELVTNTIKYTLPPDSSSTATFRVAISLEQDDVHLEFSDNGPGYPEDVLNGQRYNVGLHIVRSLIERDLRGTLKLYNSSGAVTSIHFNIDINFTKKPEWVDSDQS